MPRHTAFLCTVLKEVVQLICLEKLIQKNTALDSQVMTQIKIFEIDIIYIDIYSKIIRIYTIYWHSQYDTDLLSHKQF